ncbi:hypothetical protein U1Q18_042945 [Sarracenia purpurea var. burkii]
MNGHSLLLKTEILTNCISDPTLIPPLESAPNAFVHPEGCDSRPRQLPHQKRVRWNSNPSAITVVGHRRCLSSNSPCSPPSVSSTSPTRSREATSPSLRLPTSASS